MFRRRALARPSRCGLDFRDSRYLRGSAPLVAAALLVGALAGCTNDSSDPIEVAKVARGSVAEVVEAPATVAARSTATVTSPATGTVAKVYVRDGAQVREGELLVRISSPSAQRALSDAISADAAVASSGPQAPAGLDVSDSLTQSDRAADRAFAQAERAVTALPAQQRKAARAQLAAARAQYLAARASVTRAITQLNAGVGSASEAVASLTRAQRIQTRAAVTAARRTVDALDVRAPTAGVVSLGSDGSESGSQGSGDLSSLLGQLPSAQRGAAESLLGGAGPGAGDASVSGELSRGARVTSGQPILTVTDLSRLSLVAQVDETDVLLVKPSVRATAELAAVPGATYRARVKAVGLKPTTSARGGVSYVVRLALGSGTTADGIRAPAPRPGMSAVVRLLVAEVKDTVSVPASAVVQDGAQSAVWLVVDGVAKRRVIRVGAQGEAAYQVLAGVQVGDTVVVRGADQVREGQRVS